MVVHFPIALLFAAVFVDAASLVLRERVFWRKAALLLYVLGGVSVVVAYLAGKQAADLVFLSTEANPALTEHADLGLWTLWFFGIYVILRVGVDLTAVGRRTVVRVASFVVAAGGLVLLYTTAEHGAELVFRYGAGVEAVDHSVEAVGAPSDSTAAALSAPGVAENGSWTWKPTRAAAWQESMTFPEGDPSFTRTAMMDGGDHGDVLGLTTEGQSAMFVFDQPLDDTQMDVALNLDGFDGVVMFVHHVADGANYHFTSVGNGDVRIGRSENGDFYMLDTQAYSPEGWVTYRVVSDGDHARVYANEALVAHGHGATPEAAPVGLRLNGTGTVLLDFVRVQALR